MDLNDLPAIGIEKKRRDMESRILALELKLANLEEALRDEGIELDPVCPDCLKGGCNSGGIN